MTDELLQQAPLNAAKSSFETWARKEGLNIRRAAPKEKGGIPSSRFGLCPATYYFDEAECAWRAWANKPIAKPKKTNAKSEKAERLLILKAVDDAGLILIKTHLGFELIKKELVIAQTA